MVYSIFFAAGLGLGFTLGIASWAVCWFLGQKAAALMSSRQRAKELMEIQSNKKKHEEALDKIRASYPEMSARQSEIMEQELGSIFQTRQRT